MNSTIKGKFIKMSIAIILPMFIFIIIFTVVLVDQYNLVNVKKTLLNDSYLVQVYLYQYFSKNSKREFSEKNIYFLNYKLSEMIGLRTQLLLLKNDLQVDSKIERKRNISNDFDDFANDQGVKLALRYKKNYILKNINGHRFFLMSFPFYQNRDLLGVMRLIYPLQEEDILKNKLIIILLIVSSIIFITIIILLLIFTKQIVLPISKLKTAVQLFANGKLEEEVKINSSDEIEELAKSFNKMAGDLTDLIENLKAEKNKQKDFFDNMTHEIRTPLTTIIGYADIIKKVNSKGEKEDCLQYIESEGKRLLRLIDELLKHSKLNLYTINLKKESYDLKKLLQETVEIIRYKANKYNININLNSVESIYMEIDKDKIKQVILNLIDNAINHSETDRIDVSLYRENQEAIIKIRDYGQGISENQLEKIYKKFSGFRIDSIYEQTGHGLGLPISKKIIELHGGKLSIQSFEAKGTLVYIELA